nr:group II intron maturase-specific domain-containing protein [Nocardia brevicatena]
MGLRLSAEKTKVCHIDDGFEFLGFRIQRQTKRGTAKKYVYTWPSKKALASIIDKVRDITRRHKHRTLADLLHLLNPVLRGWCGYFQHRVSTRTFGYLDHYAWWKVVDWMRRRHHGPAWGVFRHQFVPTRVADPRRTNRDVPALGSGSHPLPLPGLQHRHSLELAAPEPATATMT